MGFLSKVPILENLTEAERHIVVDAMEPVSYKKGDILMKQGDPGEDFFIIIEGNVVCTQYAKQGRQKGFDDAPVAVWDIIGVIVVALMVNCFFCGIECVEKSVPYNWINTG